MQQNFGSVPDDPTGDMPDDGCLLRAGLYRALASVGLSQRTAPGVAKVRSSPPWLPASSVLALCRRERLPRHRPLRMYPAVSVKRSKQEAGNSSGQNPLRRTTLQVETVETRQRNMHHGSRPRLYAALSRSSSKTSPPKLKSSGCAFAHSNRA